jgi:hypothetical protein
MTEGVQMGNLVGSQIAEAIDGAAVQSGRTVGTLDINDTLDVLRHLIEPVATMWERSTEAAPAILRCYAATRYGVKSWYVDSTRCRAD